MTRRLPWLFLGAGMAAKTALLALFQATSNARYLVLAVGWDPLAVRLTDTVAGLFFGRQYGVPGNLEYGLWLVLLVLFFGAECYLLGLLLSRLVRRFGPRRAAGS